MSSIFQWPQSSLAGQVKAPQAPPHPSAFLAIIDSTCSVAMDVGLCWPKVCHSVASLQWASRWLEFRGDLVLLLQLLRAWRNLSWWDKAKSHISESIAYGWFPPLSNGNVCCYDCTPLQTSVWERFVFHLDSTLLSSPRSKETKKRLCVSPLIYSLTTIYDFSPGLLYPKRWSSQQTSQYDYPYHLNHSSSLPNYHTPIY